MPTKEFVVTVRTYVTDAEYLNSSSVQSRLTDALGYSDVLTIESVRAHDPANEVWIGKIQAIRRVRELLSCGLRDAKFLVDSAQNSVDGRCRWANVTINYRWSGTIENFQVATTE